VHDLAESLCETSEDTSWIGEGKEPLDCLRESLRYEPAVEVPEKLDVIVDRHFRRERGVVVVVADVSEVLWEVLTLG
jgi:hypothetical protein